LTLGMGVIFLPVKHSLIREPVDRMPKRISMPKVARPAVVPPPAVLPPPSAVHREGRVTIEGVVDNTVEMHHLLKTYTTYFSGTVSCGTQPCNGGTVEVKLDSDHQSEITQEATVQPDGSYSLKVSLQELPDEQVDWEIIARSPESSTQVIEGRLILTDETSDFNVDQTIAL